jgi:hypothetical protein
MIVLFFLKLKNKKIKKRLKNPGVAATPLVPLGVVAATSTQIEGSLT